MKPLIKLENVSMFYHNNTNINVGVSKINLEFFCGEFVAVTGESGAGKTTLLNIIGAALPYHDGEMYYNDVPSSHFDSTDREVFRKDNIGYICQDYNLIDSYTLLENIMAALLIKGLSHKDAKEKSLEYLDRVGLKSYANHKAAKLSSGQKQRLGIARALAKETPIILADEPTGNLDIENGKEIVKILRELSKDHLVIMVTHNLDLVIDDVTRIIRVNDGIITYDRQVKEFEPKETYLLEQKDKKEFKVAVNFARLNCKAKPKRAILLVIFMFLISFATFIFLGNIISNLDKWKAKDYDDKAFYNGNETRLVVKRYDGNPMDSSDFTKLSELKYIESVDLYDLINDFNYYYLEGEDYKYNYSSEYLYNGPVRIDESRVDHQIPYFLKDDKFLRSASSLTTDMLSAGRLPEKPNEAVVYGSADLIGTTRLVYIRALNSWGTPSYLSYNMEIVGVIEGDTEQLFISNMLALELSSIIVNQTQHNFTYYYNIGETTRYVNSRVYIFTDEMPTSEVHLSHEFFKITTKYKPESRIDDKTESKTTITIADTSLQVSTNIIMVSNEYFDVYFGNIKSYQASVYIEDYAYTDEVLAELNNAGYQAASVLRLSSLDYSDEKLTERYITIALCVVAVVIMFVLTLFVLSAFLSLNRKDYLLLRLLGMNKKEMYLTNYVEILSCAVIMYALSLIITALLDTFRVSLVHDIVKYMSWYQFVIIFAVVIFIIFATTSRFNKLLEAKYIRNGGGK